eukprot:365571-Chlamydomonas_euryale.AAC.12
MHTRAAGARTAAGNPGHAGRRGSFGQRVWRACAAPPQRRGAACGPAVPARPPLGHLQVFGQPPACFETHGGWLKTMVCLATTQDVQIAALASG